MPRVLTGCSAIRWSPTRRSVAYRLRHSSATPPVKTETIAHVSRPPAHTCPAASSAASATAAAAAAAAAASIAAPCSCRCLAMHSLLTQRVGDHGGGVGAREKCESQWNSHAQSLTHWNPRPRMKATTSACSAWPR